MQMRYLFFNPLRNKHDHVLFLSLYLILYLLMLGYTDDSKAIFGGGIGSLVKASKNGNIEKVKKLIKNDVNVNGKNRKGVTPLIEAAEYGRIDIVRVLIKSGAEVNSTANEGSTALSFAAWKGRYDVVKVLLSNGADINVRGNGGYTPLIVAATYGHENIVMLLLSRGANVNIRSDKGNTALINAAILKPENLGIVKLLLEANADPNIEKNDGTTAYFSAKKVGNKKTADYLAKSGASRIKKARQTTTRQRASRRPCKESDGIGLTENETKALRYLIKKRYKSIAVCVEEIKAVEKFKLRGNTVVKYTATIMFPSGYKTECLGRNSAANTQKRLDRNFNWSDWMNLTQNCSPFESALTGLEPMPPGERRRFKGEDEI